MDTNNFKIRSYSWQELAMCYNPGVTPLSAVKLLSKWINRNPQLRQELHRTDWHKGTRFLTPLQVEIITRYLGNP
ncbi:MAG: DUF4248 domain-containing protein [Tannerellaceae bacterium]|nr:DUF4248 domain-containing protein [Tannerellaceae bacterium]MCD8264041.1 DUF4248 domain-containing protein [Tannerellaceae bacterium]